MTLPLMLLQVADPQGPMPSTGAYIIFTIVKMIFVFTVYMVGAALLTLTERRVCAWMQDRRGPNRVGYHGIAQPLADGIKSFMKEETYPDQANIPIFVLAPALAFIPALLAGAVIPFASPLPTRWGLIDMVVAPLPIGFLFILAISSLGVYGIVLGGWASNNKYSLLGGLRSSAQMVSYEISMGMATIPVLLLAGNVSLGTIVMTQATSVWHIVTLTIAMFIFTVAAFAETNRLPFDLPEAESELVAGYHSEYSAMKFSMFPISEYANMITSSALMSTLFLGGWDIPGGWDMPPWNIWKTLATFVFFFAKVGFFIFLYMWIRWTLPRFRYDQLMALGWKFMLPLALVYIVLIATAILVLQMVGIPVGSWQFSLALGILNLILVVLVFVVLDRGRLISPASSRLDPRNIEKLRQVALHRGATQPVGSSD